MGAVPERLIRAATELLERSCGNAERVTARMIAEKAGVSLGLINYHFGSKDGLIEVCVQRIIQSVIAETDLREPYASDRERLTAWAVYVFEFLFSHESIARISILGDLRAYAPDCNSVRTQRCFQYALTEAIAPDDRALLVFMLTAAMQVAFLGSETAGALLGCDLSSADGRAAYIAQLVGLLFDGGGRADRT